MHIKTAVGTCFMKISNALQWIYVCYVIYECFSHPHKLIHYYLQKQRKRRKDNILHLSIPTHVRKRCVLCTVCVMCLSPVPIIKKDGYSPRKIVQATLGLQLCMQY